MTQVKLDPARLVQDGDDLFSIATTLDSAASTLLSRLNGCSGMAGDDNAAEEFCQGSEGYDALAGPMIDGVISHSNALRIVDAAMSNTARAYDGAQKPGAGLDPATAKPGEATATINHAKANPSDALGAGWPGPLGEFQEVIEWGLAQVGVVIPTGDEDKLQTAADAWGDFANSIQSAKSSVSSSFTNASAMTLPQKGSMLSCRTSIVSGLDKMRESADAMEQWIRDFRTQLKQMREELGWFLKQMAIEIAAELAIGGLLTIVTAGLGALATAAKVGTTVIRWCIKIAKLIEKLKTFLKGIRGVKGALVRGGLRAAKEGLQAGLASAISVTIVNEARSDEKGYQAQDVGTAFVSAFAGGTIASPVSRVLGGKGGPGFKAGVREVGAESVAGAADGLVSSAVESGMTGQDFNPISGMVLGALLGGGMTAAGKGLNAALPNSSNAGNGGVSTPDNVPTPGSGSGSSNQGGGSGPVDVSNDAPQPGAGDAGSGSGDGGGGVDIPTDAPTGGAGDAGGGSGSADGGSAGGSDTSGAPADNGGTPADGSTPSDNGGAPADSSTPTDNGGTPADTGGTPTDNGSTPADNGGTPAENGSTPADNGGTPTDNGGTPADNGSTPADNGGTPTDNGGTPADNGGTPTDNGGTPADNGGTPTDNGGTPADNGGTPADNGSTPVDNGGTPADNGGTPATDGGAPTDNGSSPADNGATPVEAPTVDVDGGNGSGNDAPAAAAAGGASSTKPGDGSATDADGSATDGTDGTESDSANEADADTANDGEGTSPEASDGDAMVGPEEAAAGIGGAAVAAGAAALIGKPSFLPTHTPGGSTPAAPKPAGPNADGAGSNGTAAQGSPDAGSPDAGTPDAGTPDAGTPDAGSPDAATPDGQSPDAQNQGDGQNDGTQNNSSERTLDEIDQALNDINPNYDPSDPANGYATNCGNTSSNLNDFLNGQSSSEASTGTLDVPEMEARTGNPQTPMTPEQIEASLREMGAGSHCVVGIDRSTGDGHWFNAYFDGTDVWSLDAQTGSRSPWPPAESNATNCDASIRPEHVVNPDGSKPGDTNATPDASTPSTPASPAATAPAATTPTTHSGAPADGSAPDGSAPDGTAPDGTAPDGTAPDGTAPDGTAPDGTAPDGSAPDGTGTDGSDGTGDGDRSGRRWPKWKAPVDRVDPSHASDGSDGAGTTYNGYDIPELTPEIRQELDALAAKPDSPIVKNDDGSYSLKDPIQVDTFNRQDPNQPKNSDLDWDEFQRQVGMQQQGLNNLTIEEWRHNVDFYRQYNRVAKTEQSNAIKALKAAGVDFTDPVVLHGPDQVAGGRADRFDGAGDLAVNSSLGSQWKSRVAGLSDSIDAASLTIDPKLLPHIKLNVELGAHNVETGVNASQSTLTSAQPVTSGPNGSTPNGTTPSSTTGSSATATGTVRTGANPEPSTPESSTPESSTPEPSTAESSAPESSTQESSAPESSTPESSTPESSTPESTTPEASTPEASEADSADADSTEPDTVETDSEATAEEPSAEIADDSTADDSTADDSTADEPAQSPVSDAIHHPVLDQAFPHLQTPEARVQSIHVVNGLGVTVDQGRFLNNCHYVVNALELRFRGYDVVASPTVLGAQADASTGAIDLTYEGRFTHSIAADWVQADGSRRDFQNLGDFQGSTPMDALEALTASWPEGGRGFIAGYWKTGGGHIFTVVKEADGVKLYDGQVNDTDVSGYLNTMHFNETSIAPWKDITVMRVDDLVPTSEVLKTSKPWTQPEYQLMLDWRDAADPSARPQQMIDREIAANERWRARNDELIAERIAILHDPATSMAEAMRLQGEIQVLRDQNLRLEAGAVQFKLEIAPPAAAAAPAPVLAGVATGGGSSHFVTNGPGDDVEDEERD